jgi:hypothetical protein
LNRFLGNELSLSGIGAVIKEEKWYVSPFLMLVSFLLENLEQAMVI